jgi:hypothetical protein
MQCSKGGILFDHLVGAQQYRRWNCDADRSRSLEIDDKLECGWLFNRQIGGLGASESVNRPAHPPDLNPWPRAELALGFKSRAPSIRQQLEAKQTSGDRGRLSTGRD